MTISIKIYEDTFWSFNKQQHILTWKDNEHVCSTDWELKCRSSCIMEWVS